MKGKPQSHFSGLFVRETLIEASKKWHLKDGMGLPCIPRLVSQNPGGLAFEVSDRTAFLLSKVISVNQSWNKCDRNGCHYNPYCHHLGTLLCGQKNHFPLHSFPAVHSTLDSIDPLFPAIALDARTLFWFCWKLLLPWRCPSHHQDKPKGLFSSFLNLYKDFSSLLPLLSPYLNSVCMLRSVA